jgi:transcriptional regulator with XRE-family HTH domain
MSTDIRIKLGSRIRYYRKKNGWTQFEMSERTGIDRSYLSELENGKVEICLDRLTAIAQAYKREPWQLLKFKKLKEKA